MNELKGDFLAQVNAKIQQSERHSTTFRPDSCNHTRLITSSQPIPHMAIKLAS